jgi:hypothetical protein
VQVGGFGFRLRRTSRAEARVVWTGAIDTIMESLQASPDLPFRATIHYSGPLAIISSRRRVSQMRRAGANHGLTVHAEPRLNPRWVLIDHETP